MGGNQWWSVPLAVILVISMYSDAAEIFPVALVLLQKGAALGNYTCSRNYSSRIFV